jgi:hypothetical protein
MAFYSLVMYAGNGSNRNFTIHFPYLDKSHVKVKINSVPTTTFTWLTSSSIQFDTAPAAGVNIEICRETPLNYAPVDFTDGSILLEQDLDLLTTFNLYVDQELADRVALALSKGSGGSGGSGGASNAQDSGAAAAAEAARIAAEKAAREAEAARDAAVKAGANGANGAATSGVGKFSSVTVKNSPTAYVDVQTAADYQGNACGVRYLQSAGTPKYQSIYTPSDGIFRYTAADAKAEWRWVINGGEPAMSFKRTTGVSSLENDYYTLTLGLPPLSIPDGMGRPTGGALNIYGTSQNMRLAKIEMFNDGELSGGLIASPYELNLYSTNKVTLMGLNSETYFTAWRDRAVLLFSTNRNNQMEWRSDGNVVLARDNVVVWSINNYLTSDVRLKTDIKPLEGSSLEKVKQLTAKTYLWKDDLMGKGDKREIGLIAQEVAEVVPEAVSKMSSDADTLGVA